MKTVSINNIWEKIQNDLVSDQKETLKLCRENRNRSAIVEISNLMNKNRKLYIKHVNIYKEMQSNNRKNIREIKGG